ncbi:MAG: SDR family oxidoreductase [Candidatus Margulisiibacteriota bacterium]
MAKYLITGAAGFIGSNLVSHLLDAGQTVVALDNFSGGFRENLAFVEQHPNAHLFRLIDGDIRDFKTCQEACDGATYVLHQGALGSVPRSMTDPALYHENNITGTLNMLMAAKEAGVKRFVFASSSSVYGDTPTLPKEETMFPNPKSPYAVTKLTGEYYCKIFWTAYGLPTVMLRYFNIFGPRQNPNSQYSAVIPKFITACIKQESPIIFGNGEQTRDFTFVENVIQANLRACEAPQEAFGQPINIGCGSRISLNHLAKNIQAILKCDHLPIEYQAPRIGDVQDSLAATERMKNWLGLTTPISLEEGLYKTTTFYTC